MGSYHIETYLGERTYLGEPRRTAVTESEIALQFPRGAEPALLIAPKIRPGLESGESLNRS